MGERVHRSVMNIKVGMFFYVLSLFLAFFSRKIFLDCLGAEFIGLTGMLMNIMSFLSVAELGIGTSISFFLYKPLQEDNHERINEVMSILAYLYRFIGYIIGFCGLIISLFFPWWFDGLTVGLSLVYFTFYSFLATSMSGYIFNYKQLLVVANQKQYLVNAYFQSIGIAQSIIQIFLAYNYHNLYLWVLVGLIFTIIGIIVFNYRIRQLYPWLKISIKEGHQNLKNYPEILKKTRQIFIQRVKDFILYRSDEILVGAFVSVVQVAFYGNYTIITNKLNFLVNILSDGMSAGVGNLVAEGNVQNTMKVFWELTIIRFFIAGAIVYGILLFIQPVIFYWLGPKYLLDDLIVYLLSLNIFIMISRGAIEIFVAAYGVFSDIWAAWAELIINLSITICLAPHYGIIGILLGKIISVATISLIWRPYFLFSQGMHIPAKKYWLEVWPAYLSFIIFATIIIIVRLYLINPYFNDIALLTTYGLLCYPLILICFFLTMFYSTKGAKYFAARIPTVYHFLTINKKYE